MDLRDTLNRYYYDSTVCELRQLAKNCLLYTSTRRS